MVGSAHALGNADQRQPQSGAQSDGTSSRPLPKSGEQLADLLSVFATTLKDHLRHINDLKRVPGFEDLGDDPAHPPAVVASRIYGLIESWRSRKLISDQLTRPSTSKPGC